MADSIDIKLPEDQMEGTISVIGAWLKKKGERVEKDEPLLELETDKVNTELAAPGSGTLVEIFRQEGDEIKPDDILGRIETSARLSTSASDSAARPARAVAKATGAQSSKKALDNRDDRSHLLSPSVRRLCRAHDLEPAMIEGTGRAGRITYDDVQRFLAKTKKQPTAVAAKSGGPGASSSMVPHSAMRRGIADHMVRSLLKVAPHVTSIFEMDMTAIIAHRRARKAEYAAKGVNLTFTAYFVRAAVEALTAVPVVNSRYHEDALELFEDLNIGIGASLEDKGLIVPVIHGAQNQNLFGIAGRLQDLTERARTGKLEPKDVQGGTFTISNHGVSGSLIATPIIINQPQSAILGVGKLQKRVVVVESDGQDAIVIKPMCYVTLSIDHRALDAFQTNAFLSRFVETIEQWS